MPNCPQCHAVLTYSTWGTSIGKNTSAQLRCERCRARRAGSAQAKTKNELQQRRESIMRRRRAEPLAYRGEAVSDGFG